MEAEGTTTGAASATAKPARPVNCPQNLEGETSYMVGKKTNGQRSYIAAPNDVSTPEIPILSHLQIHTPGPNSFAPKRITGFYPAW